MAVQQSNLQKILSDLGIVPVYEYNGRTFYDTKDVFDRHNFARDVKRNVDEDEWVLEKTKYYLSERGVVMFSFKKGVTKVMERFMRVLESPAFPDLNSSRQDAPVAMGIVSPVDQGVMSHDPRGAEAFQAMYANDSAPFMQQYHPYQQNPYVVGMMQQGNVYQQGYGAGMAPQAYASSAGNTTMASPSSNNGQNVKTVAVKEQDGYAPQYHQPPQNPMYGHQTHHQQAQQQGYVHYGNAQAMSEANYGVPAAENLKAAGADGVMRISPHLLHKPYAEWAKSQQMASGVEVGSHTSPDSSWESQFEERNGKSRLDVPFAPLR